jgi:hypothetical protein
MAVLREAIIQNTVYVDPFLLNQFAQNHFLRSKSLFVLFKFKYMFDLKQDEQSQGGGR